VNWAATGYKSSSAAIKLAYIKQGSWGVDGVLRWQVLGSISGTGRITLVDNKASAGEPILVDLHCELGSDGLHAYIMQGSWGLMGWCVWQVLGSISGSGRITLVDNKASAGEPTPVDLDLEKVRHTCSEALQALVTE